MSIKFHYRNCQNVVPAAARGRLDVISSPQVKVEEGTVVGIRICHMTECPGCPSPGGHGGHWPSSILILNPLTCAGT